MTFSQYYPPFGVDAIVIFERQNPGWKAYHVFPNSVNSNGGYQVISPKGISGVGETLEEAVKDAHNFLALVERLVPTVTREVGKLYPWVQEEYA